MDVKVTVANMENEARSGNPVADSSHVLELR